MSERGIARALNAGNIGVSPQLFKRNRIAIGAIRSD
jgi:hypothetical protein